MKRLCTLMMLATLVGCQKPQKPTDDELAALVEMMHGAFNSAQQAQADEQYFNISLKMVPIWTERTDGHWLYVEQAVATHMDKPYRQRLYHVTRATNGAFQSAVYELPNPQSVIGGFEQPELLASIDPESLKLRAGCAVILRSDGAGGFVGQTQEKQCLSQLRGASYATSKVQINPTQITSWDQGFDDQDQQVWGAVAGPYVFDRLTP